MTTHLARSFTTESLMLPKEVDVAIVPFTTSSSAWFCLSYNAKLNFYFPSDLILSVSEIILLIYKPAIRILECM